MVGAQFIAHVQWGGRVWPGKYEAGAHVLCAPAVWIYVCVRLDYLRMSCLLTLLP